MKVNTKKVRKLLASAIQCPRTVFTSKELYEIKKLCDYIDKCDEYRKPEIKCRIDNNTFPY